jgi:hypothetical protein
MIAIAAIMTPAPSLISPPHNGVITTCGTYKFDWTAKPKEFELRHYHIVIDTDLNFSGEVFYRSYPTTSSQNVNTGLMQDNHRYYWAVATEARLWPWQDFEWSSFKVDSFTTDLPGLETISPAQNNTGISQLPEFKWSRHCVLFPEYWHFILDNTSDFSNPIIDEWINLEANEGCVFSSKPPLAPGTKYYWKANGWVNSETSTGWTNTGVFTTSTSDPWPPTLSSPVNHSELPGDKITFTWKPICGVVHYHVQLDDEESFIDPVYEDSITTTSFEISDLVEGTTYYWRVRIKYATCGYSRWSDVFNFSILCPQPGVPVLNEPANGAVNIPLDLAYLLWEGVNRADLYHIELDDNDDFSSVVFAANTDKCYDQCTGLSPYTIYYWRVRGYHQLCGYGDWSTVWSFKTGEVSGIKNNDGKEQPHSFSLFQNYPNPFNLFTTIRFELPQPTFITIDIYNALGERIRTLVQEQLCAGSWAINWNGTDDNGMEIPSGIYIYRLHTLNYTASRKMMLIK